MIKNNLYLLVGNFFLIISFYLAYLLRGSDFVDVKLFVFVILISVSTDIGGFLFGKLFKGPKLTKISPNKTYEGLFGGIFFSNLLSCIFSVAIRK